MSFIKSITCGTPGNYNVFGIPVDFKNELSPLSPLNGLGKITKFMNFLTNNRIFQLSTLGYVRVFLHEMSHAMMSKLLTYALPEVTIYIPNCNGITVFYGARSRMAWKNNLVSAAGSMTNIAFSICNIFAINRLKEFLPWPASLVLKAGNAIWITGELLYALASVLQKDHGDFGKIFKSNPFHFAIASTALIAESVLGLCLCRN
jgi:hypothetical protein